MGDSRTKNTSRNILAGLWNRFSTILLSFVNRTIIIYILGAEFSGLNSLFLSVLGVLSIAELGIDVAIVQSMYKPIAEGDKRRICELLTLYKKSYYIVGSIILGIGLLLIPFIPYLINEELPASVNLYALYILYLINSCAISAKVPVITGGFLILVILDSHLQCTFFKLSNVNPKIGHRSFRGRMTKDFRNDR